jgi:trigger factor
MPESQVLLDISADDDEFAQAMDRAVRKVSREVNVPGFRRGKAPRHIIERLFGRELFLEEAHKEIMDKLYRQALDQESLVPVGPPQVDVVVEEPLGFRVLVPVFPTVDPGPYREVRVEPIDATVDDAAVEDVVERLRKNQSPWIDPEEPRTPREGDQVTVDIVTLVGEEPFQDSIEDAVYVLGETNLLDPLRELIETLQVGESGTTTIDFAEDDEKVNESVRGKSLTYQIALKALKERDLLVLDDDFAQSFGEAETLEELRQNIRASLHQEKTVESRTEVINEIINKMAETATIDLPTVMIDEEVDEEVRRFGGRLTSQRLSLDAYLRMSGQTEEEFKAEVRPNAARRLRNSLLLREIAKREEIEITDQDLADEIDRITAPAEDSERLREVYQSDYFSGMLRNDLFEQRVTERLIEIATEGRGAVLNGWVAPEPEPAPLATDTETVETAVTDAEETSPAPETADVAVSVADATTESEEEARAED